jgi:hypothetical protein
MSTTAPSPAAQEPPKPAAKAPKAPKKAKVKHGTYRYEAETLDGQQIKGQIEAPSANSARNELAVQGLRVTKISEKKGLQLEITKEKVPLVDIMHFSRQMATFLRAGVPMPRTSASRRSSATCSTESPPADR